MAESKLTVEEVMALKEIALLRRKEQLEQELSELKAKTESNEEDRKKTLNKIRNYFEE